MTRILAMVVLGLSLAGCVYAGPAPGYGYYNSGYYAGGYPGAPIGEAVASPGAVVD